MRIVGGKYKSRQILRPSELTTRPTSDKIRQAIFNILQNYYQIDFEETEVLDAFAGSGAMGLEALSYQAKYVTFIEKNIKAFLVLKKNALNLITAPKKYSLIQTDCLSLKLSPSPVKLVFLDPPYKKNLIKETCTHLLQNNWIKTDYTLLCVETLKEAVPTSIAEFKCDKLKVYGNTAISFWI